MGVLEPPSVDGSGGAQAGRARRPPRPSSNPPAPARMPGHLLWVPEDFQAQVPARGGSVQGQGGFGQLPGCRPWLAESGGRSCGACTDCGQGRSAPGSPHQQAGQSEMEMHHKAFRVPGGSRLYLQPYNPEQARCHLISEAKQVRAWLVLGYKTAWEYRVL